MFERFIIVVEGILFGVDAVSVGVILARGNAYIDGGLKANLQFNYFSINTG